MDLIQNQRKLVKYNEWIHTVLGQISAESKEQLNKLQKLKPYYLKKIKLCNSSIEDFNSILSKFSEGATTEQRIKKFKLYEQKIMENVDRIKLNLTNYKDKHNKVSLLLDKESSILETFKNNKQSLTVINDEINNLKEIIKSIRGVEIDIENQKCIKEKQYLCDDKLHNLFVINNDIHKLFY